MVLKGIELKPGMVIISASSDKAVVIPHKQCGIAFVSYSHSKLWSPCLENVLSGDIKEIRDIPSGRSLVDGNLLWREAKYRINGGVELNEEQFLKEIRTYSGKTQVEVI